jgi:2-keto-4-pentenoate hydratase/2-oxohepta-3-ene-1,7-dioic acid hydratase in catechol pathway
VARIISNAGPTRGRICYAAVQSVDQGMPATVRVLRSRENQPLCTTQAAAESESPTAAMERLRQAMDAADRAAPAGSTTESIAPGERAGRILAPVPVTQRWVDEDWVFVPTAGLNYAEHAAEVGMSGKRFLFPKPTAPTSAYGDVPQERRTGGKGGAVCLLDHEVEIAFITLQNLELSKLARIDIPQERGELWPYLAFFAVNDVSDREPIILGQESDTGYTSAKGRKGYMPAGPWLVSGRHGVPMTKEGGTEALDLALQTREAGESGWTRRQSGVSSTMELGPIGILQELAYRQSKCPSEPGQCSMEDHNGNVRMLMRGDTLPAGSIVLTGTPRGTAIKVPSLPAKSLSH